MYWRKRLTSCEDFIDLHREYQSICWCWILNDLFPFEGCGFCPVALLYDELKQKYLGDS